MNETVKLNEMVPCTYQGEGVDTGQRVSLFRFKYCNLRCKFCDTLTKMRDHDEVEYKLSELQKILDEEKTAPLISGGEPTLNRHFDDTLTLINKLHYIGILNLETNGFQLLGLMEKIGKEKRVDVSYSPKIFTQKELVTEISRTEKLIKYPNVYFKIVYEGDALVQRYLEYLATLYVNHRVYLMPEGITRETLIKNSGKVFDACERFKFNFSSRDHIIYKFV